MKLVKDYKDVQQKIVTLFDKLFIIDDFINNIIRFFIVIRQKRKSKRSSKLSTTVFKSLIITIDSISKQKSSIVAVSFSIFSISVTSNSKFSTNIFSLVSAEQRLVVVIFFKQVFIVSKTIAIGFKSFVLEWKFFIVN